MAKKDFSQTVGRAGLPESVIMKDYPKCDHDSKDLDDTITLVDSTIDKSVGKSKKYKSNQH